MYVHIYIYIWPATLINMQTLSIRANTCSTDSLILFPFQPDQDEGLVGNIYVYFTYEYIDIYIKCMNTMWIPLVAAHRHSACPAIGTGSSHLQLPPVQIRTHTHAELAGTPWVTSASSSPMQRTDAHPAQTSVHFHT